MEHKGYRVLPGECNTIKVLNMGKGALPRALSGEFTSPSFAIRAIDAYLESKGKVDAKSDSSSGD